MPKADSVWARRRIYRFTSIALMASLAGCANISYPTQTDISITKALTQPATEITSSQQARQYIAAAKQKMQREVATLNDEEVGGDVAIAAAGLTAVTAAAFKWSSDIILGSTIGGGAAYGFTRDFNPRGQRLVVGEGLAALDCVDKTSSPALDDVSTTGRILSSLWGQVNTLVTQISEAKNENSHHGDEDKVILNGEKEVAHAISFIDEHRPKIYEAVRIAVNHVIDATNTNLERDRADPTAFKSLASGIEIPGSPGVTSVGHGSAKTGVNTGSNTHTMGLHGILKFLKSQKKIPSIFLSLAQNTAQLNTSVRLAGIALGGGPAGPVVVSFAGCVPGATKLVVTPPSRKVDLHTGEVYSFVVTKGQFEWRWVGAVPPKNVLQAAQGGSSQVVMVTAGSGKSDKTFDLEFAPVKVGGVVDIAVKKK